MKAMIEKKKAKIINECLEAVIQGCRSQEECIQLFPELKQDLLDVFSVSRPLHNFQALQISTRRMRQMKDQLMFKLADRGEVVTKTSQFRYSWQNTKRRFAMTWVIIVTTILSLISGAGVVYASNTALPGEMLYPVKIWSEDVQLAISPEAVDVKLYEEFAGHRIEELIALAEAGKFANIDDLVDGYQNLAELMTQLMASIEAKNPEEATRLRNELEIKLQEHARIIEGFIQGEIENLPLQERLREMLQTNTQTRLRLNKEVIIVDPADVAETTPEVTDTAADVQNQDQNQNRVRNIPDEFIENGALKFQFRFDRDLEDGVYTEVAGKRYECSVDGALVTCDLTGVSGVGKLNLYQQNSNQLLYSYNYDHAYEYLWKGTKESSGTETQKQGSPDSGEGSHEKGQNGKN